MCTYWLWTRPERWLARRASGRAFVRTGVDDDPVGPDRQVPELQAFGSQPSLLRFAHPYHRSRGSSFSDASAFADPLLRERSSPFSLSLK